jgi:hypothetical protein
MPKLTDQERLAVSAAWQKRMSERRQVIPIRKHAVLAVVSSVDDWVESVAQSFNEAFGGANLTIGQKLRVLEYVILARRRREPDGGDGNGE